MRADVIEALIIFPHQLFATNVALARHKTVFLVEDALFFLHYRFHKKKLILHRASMQAHAVALQAGAAEVIYIDYRQASTMEAALRLVARVAHTVHYIDPVDDWLRRRLLRSAVTQGCTLIQHDTPMFLNGLDELRPYLDKPRPSLAAFYAAQRKKRGILVADGRPVGGRWSLDADNRRRLPATVPLPSVPNGPENAFIREARQYVNGNFEANPGNPDGIRYPVTHADANHWLTRFLDERLPLFGAYEDALTSRSPVVFHSLLTPMLNTGLLTPREVIDSTLEHAKTHHIPLNSLEGFIRQIMGWREYIRGNYEFHGRAQRIKNFWGHRRPLPASFWSGQTGIEPVDAVIAKILDMGYAHHIERLMVLTNFMLLCEFSPHDVHRWFMEMFVDAYDWVMVPNVYGMGLSADGGLMMTKPYISSSNYILRMSDFNRGPWCAIWDGLFWRFIAKHRGFFEANPRLSVMVSNLDRLSAVVLRQHHDTAQKFLQELDEREPVVTPADPDS